MKKSKMLLNVVAILVLMLIFSNATNKEIAGDVNGDKKVDETDLAMVQEYILDERELSESEKTRADTNEDGKIDIEDLANIQKFILGVD